MQEGEETEHKIILEMQCFSTEKKASKGFLSGRSSKGFPVRSIFGIIKTATEIASLSFEFWQTKSRDMISAFQPLL